MYIRSDLACVPAQGQIGTEMYCVIKGEVEVIQDEEQLVRHSQYIDLLLTPSCPGMTYPKTFYN
eukprot:COSAG02_NODE_17296_length_1014_cov_1.262295_1_plen_63_part_01